MLEYLLDLVFREKRVCFLCGYAGEEVSGYLCPDCKPKFKRVGLQRCSVCGKSIDFSGRKLSRCKDCIKTYKHFASGIAPFIYEGAVKTIIADFKYNDKTHLKKLLGHYMVDEVVNSGYDNIDLIVPVPLHTKKENMRGYNQAELLADYISDKLSIQLVTESLKRTEYTAVQKSLKKLQRSRNLEGAFSVENKRLISGKTILLVDDVYTTGNTLNICSKVLKESGSKEVYVVTSATSICK